MSTTKKAVQHSQPTGSALPGNRIITLDEFIIRSEKDFDYATGELTGLLRDTVEQTASGAIELAERGAAAEPGA